MDDAQTLITTALAGGDTALLAVGGAALALAAIRWSVPYLKGFFKTAAK